MMTANANKTNIIELLQQSAGYLESCGISDARAEADILLAHVLGLTRDRLYLEHTMEISPGQRDRFRELFLRRGTREPLAYLTHSREFMGLDFYVDSRVLVPRPETELLVQKALAVGNTKLSQDNGSPKAAPFSVLDLGTGSGAIAVSLAYFKPDWSVTAVDISTDALDVAAYNAATMKVNVAFYLGDLFQPVPSGKYDLIVSNPPYVSEAEYLACMEEVKKEPALALLAGADGLDFYRKIAASAKDRLKQNGVVLVEIGCSQGTAVSRLFAEHGFEVEIFVDYAGLDRIVIATRQR